MCSLEGETPRAQIRVKDDDAASRRPIFSAYTSPIPAVMKTRLHPTRVIIALVIAVLAVYCASSNILRQLPDIWHILFYPGAQETRFLKNGEVWKVVRFQTSDSPTTVLALYKDTLTKD